MGYHADMFFRAERKVGVHRKLVIILQLNEIGLEAPIAGEGLTQDES
jgi:hypothetical protein